VSRPLCSPENSSCLVKMMVGCILLVAAYSFYALITLTLFPQPTRPGTGGCGLAALGRLFFLILLPSGIMGIALMAICITSFVDYLRECRNELEEDVEY
jgi:hypothetical protein